MRWLALVLLAACDDLPRRDPACGNGVLDPGEDCDSNLASCNAQCRRVCDTRADCDAGWGCGTDHVCRHAIGRWREVGAPVPEVVRDVQLGDLDGDGRPDAFGVGIGMFGRLVKPDGTFGAGVARPSTLTTFGVPAFGRLDDDAFVDVVIAGARSLDIRRGGDAARGFAPAPQPAIVVDPGAVVTMVRAGAGRFDYVLGLSTANGDGVMQIHRTDDPTQSTMLSLGPADAFTLFALTVDLDGDGRDAIVLEDTSRSTCTLFDVTLVAGRPTMSQRETIVLPPTTFAAGFLSVDVTGDGVRDLVMRRNGGTLVAAGDGVGGFDPPVAMPALDAAGVLFAMADLDGDGVLDLVGSNGVQVAGGALIPGQTSWGGATVADFNRDGFADVAAISGAGLEVFLGGPDGFSRSLHLSDRRLAGSLLAGDFDGDRFPDLALAANAGDDAADQELLIIFGGPGGVTDEVATVTTLAPQTLVSLSAATLPVGIAVPDGATDLAVQNDVDLSYFIGSADRRPISSAPLRVDPTDVLVGRFEGGEPGILLFEPGHAAELVRGHGDARVVATDLVPLAVDGSVVPWCIRADFEAFPGALVADLDGDGRDEIIGIPCDAASQNQIQIAHVDGPVNAPVLTAVNVGYAPVKFRGLRAARLADLDGDGALDLVMSFDGFAPNPNNPGGVLVLWGKDGTLTGDGRTALAPADLGLESPGGFTLVEADGDPGVELLFGEQPRGAAPFDNARITLIDVVDRTLSATPHTIPVIGLALAAGDLDGDGVDDLVIGEIDGLHTFLGCSEDDATPACR